MIHDTGFWLGAAAILALALIALAAWHLSRDRRPVCWCCGVRRGVAHRVGCRLGGT